MGNERENTAYMIEGPDTDIMRAFPKILQFALDTCRSKFDAVAACSIVARALLMERAERENEDVARLTRLMDRFVDHFKITLIKNDDNSIPEGILIGPFKPGGRQ